MLALTIHKVKATMCGQGHKGDGMLTDWDEVNCSECLKSAPFRRG
jgi:hypothetical protein